jgi:hypothetical protein
MAVAEGARLSYDEPIATGGNREDLSDILFDVSPTDTPFLTACKKRKSTATTHAWLTDTLEDPADNANVEGDDASPVKAASRVRLDNQTQIFKKHAVVSGTQESVKKGGGIKSEMAYQVSRRLKAIKRDAERAFIGVNNPKVAGSDTVARELGAFTNYMDSNGYFGGAGFVAPVGNGGADPTAGTARALTEDIMKVGLEALWTNSGGSENILGICGAKQRGRISTFTSSSTRYVSTDDSKLNASIDVYDGDYHTVTVTPDRYCKPGSLFLIDPEYIAIADLRPIFTKDLAITGDSTRKEIVWETTFEMCNPEAHVEIADLTIV